MSSSQTSTSAESRAESGLGTEEELQRRISLATPADTVRGMAFHASLDAIRAALGEEALARCLEPLKEKSYKSFFTYPVSEYLRLQYSTAWLLSEKYGGFDNAVRRIGGGIAPGFLASVVGKAFMMLAKEGPRQFLNNMPVAYRATSSFGEMTVHWTGPRSGVLTTKRDFRVYMSHEGGLMGLFRTLGVPDARVDGRQIGPLDNQVEFSWG